ncbi:hypothetical protein [Nocardioides plantarum]|uniref:DUF4190 domain-containing protein n=1 Tax=Nocardioides plantarum TaxID=29299 RepID=A0ABV5KG52_9ACTN|nr:hypothetical protein [Nocardioides plantarum]
MSETPDLGKRPQEEPGVPPVNPYHPYQPTPYVATGPTGVPFGPPPDHPSASTVLVLGILGLVLCQVLSPVAWVLGGRTLREIDASGGRYGGRGTVNAGRICGIVGTIILVLSLLLVVAFVVIALSVPGSFDDDYGLAPTVAPLR